MNAFNDEVLGVAIKRLLEDIAHLSAKGEVDPALSHGSEEGKAFHELLEKRARSVTVAIKPCADLLDLNDKTEKRHNDAQYTRLEDLPPLNPEDEAWLKQEFYSLANRVSLANGNGPVLARPIDK